MKDAYKLGFPRQLIVVVAQSQWKPELTAFSESISNNNKTAGFIFVQQLDNSV